MLSLILVVLIVDIDVGRFVDIDVGRFGAIVPKGENFPGPSGFECLESKFS